MREECVMTLETHTEFLISLSRENRGTDATDHWSVSGKGDGQREYAEQKMKWRDADIALQTREVVTTSWTRQKPDPPCDGSGYAHKPHGECPGYTYDRT